MYKNIPIDFVQLETIPSTHLWARENHPTFNPSHITCITAREQTAGRGRQNRKWLSPKDANLYLTLYFVVPSGATYLSNLGQIMALSCAELLLTLPVPIQLKWPNDLLIAHQKIGGVLTDTLPLGDQIGIILSLGLNVNMPQAILDTIDQPATSLHLHLKHPTTPTALVQPLLEQLIPRLVQLQTFGFAPFQSRYEQLLTYKGETITVQLPQKKIQGICDSITSEGCLRLRIAPDQFITLSIGEIL